jgi:hypothetical protein
MIDLVRGLEDGGEAESLTSMEVDEALGYLWPRLQELTQVMPAHGAVPRRREQQPEMS